MRCIAAILCSVAWSVRAADIAASSTSWLDVSNAYNTATTGDRIIIPTGSNEWAAGLVISKKLTLSGSGSNGNQTVIQFGGTGQNPIFDLSAQYCTVSNLQLRSPTITDGWLIIARSNMCRIRDVHFVNGLASVIAYTGGLCYNSTFLNCERMGRSFALSGNNRFTQLGSPFDQSIMGDTNFFVWEDCKWTHTASSLSSFPLVISSERGGFWIVRYCEIDNVKSFSPAFDAHGAIDGTENGNIACQIYGNTITSVNGDSDKFADIRGGLALICSNVANVTWSRDIHFRNADQNSAFYFSPGSQVTNCYFWENYENTSTLMGVDVEANDASIITTNQSYFGRAPSTLYRVQYPHFLREGVTHDPNASGAVFGAVSIPGPGRSKKGSLF